MYLNAILLPNADIINNNLAYTFLSPENNSNNADDDTLIPPYVCCYSRRPRVHRIQSEVEGLLGN